MNLKNEKGSITIFVIIGMLFMSAFLIISYASNVNRSKIVKEQFNIISDIYSYKDGNESSYDRTYTALRKKNKQIMTANFEEIEDKSILLTKTFEEEVKNYRIYGNTQGVGNQIIDETDTNYGKYEIPIKIYRTDSQDNLPGYLLEQYQELEYIESNGTQYIYKRFETSHEVGSTFTWETEVMWTNVSTRQLMGYNDPLYWGIDASGKYECGAGKASNIYASTDKYDKVKYVITQLAETEEEYKEKKELYINGQYAIGKEVTHPYGVGKRIYMFTYKGNTLNTYCRVKYFKFYDNDELIGNLIPCYRKSDKKTGMYDLVDNIFYEAQGGNEFIKGPNTSAGYRVCLDKPLMQVGDVADYIDFEEGKVIRHIGDNLEILETPIEEQMQLPELLTYEDYTKIEILTSVKPSKVELEYTGYKFD